MALRERRFGKRKSFQHVADQLEDAGLSKISASALHRYETEGRVPDVLATVALAELYKVPSDWLLRFLAADLAGRPLPALPAPQSAEITDTAAHSASTSTDSHTEGVPDLPPLEGVELARLRQRVRLIADALTNIAEGRDVDADLLRHAAHVPSDAVKSDVQVRNGSDMNRDSDGGDRVDSPVEASAPLENDPLARGLADLERDPREQVPKVPGNATRRTRGRRKGSR